MERKEGEEVRKSGSGQREKKNKADRTSPKEDHNKNQNQNSRGTKNFSTASPRMLSLNDDSDVGPCSFLYSAIWCHTAL
jgi:hypothetical protein